MKFYLLFTATLLALATPALAQTDGATDAPTTNQTPAATLAGDYPVTFHYKAMWKSGQGSSGPGVTPMVKVTTTAPQTIALQFPDFIFSEKFQIHTFTVNNVAAVPQADGSTSINCGEFSSTDGKYKIKGYSIRGTIKDNKLQFSAVYKAGAMPFKLYVDFTSQP